MISSIKKIIHYEHIYSFLKETFVYKRYKIFLGLIANIRYGFPGKHFFIVGVTGTDGKTTTVNLIHNIINDNKGKCVLISTAVIKIGEKEIPNTTKLTSLDISDLLKILRDAYKQGCTHAVIEVSSIGIHQHIFAGITIDCAVLTNITSEHLDYHKTIQRYAEIKKRLFKGLLISKKKSSLPIAILPQDDHYGKLRMHELHDLHKTNYGIKEAAKIHAKNIKQTLYGTSFELTADGEHREVNLTLLGTYNVYNSLAAIGVGINLDISIDKIIQSLEGFSGISGRMEKFDNNGIHYFIDFAHTPNGLESVLTFLSANKTPGKKLITMFGCPGNRDVYKRPVMGGIAEQYSDIVILTQDDSDTEPYQKILDEVTKGITRPEGPTFYIIPDRGHAIKKAIHLANPGDIVLLAGKGHETVRLTNKGKIPRNDKKKLIELLN